MSNISTLSRTAKIKWIVTVLLTILCFLVPVGDIFTIQMRAFLVATVFVLSLAAFELVPNFLVGLLLPVMYVILGACPINIALGIWSSSFMVFMCIGGMVFANVLDECGLLSRIVLWAGTKCKGNFVKLLFALLIAGIVIMFATFTNAWVVTLVLCYGVVKSLHLEHTKEGILIMVVGQIVSTASLNFIFSPASIALMGTGVQMIYPDFELKWWAPMVYNFPLLIINVIFLFVTIKLYKPEKLLKGGQEYFETEYSKLGCMTINEKKAIVLTVVLFLYILTQPLHKLDINYGFIIIPALCFMPGLNIATKENSLDNVNFGFVLFLASCMGIGTVGGYVGIGEAISSYITPFLEGCPIPVFLFGCVILGIIMNILMTPSAMVSLFAGPLTGLGAGLSVTYPALAIFAMFYANDMVFFPYENGYLLLLFSFGVMSMQDFMKYNVIKMGVTLVLFWVLVIPWWYLMGVI